MKIISTEVEPVTERHQTPDIAQWTLHSVEIEPEKAAEIAGMPSTELYLGFAML